MSMTVGEFFTKDTFLAIGCLLPSTTLFLFSIYEKHLAENMETHWIGISDVFFAIILSALSLILSIALGILLSQKIKSKVGVPRMIVGLSIGGGLSLLGIIVFLVVIK